MRRSENLGDPQPHPCFCLTTVGFWFEIEGDWSRGYEWESSIGVPATDVGGNLLGILNERDIEWRPLLRTNQVNLDQLWFGIYDNVAYHHGAGFRRKVARHQELVGNSEVRAASTKAKIPASVPVLGRAERSVRHRVARRSANRRLDALADESEVLSSEVFGWIQTDPEFYRRFLDRPSAERTPTEPGAPR